MKRIFVSKIKDREYEVIAEGFDKDDPGERTDLEEMIAEHLRYEGYNVWGASGEYYGAEEISPTEWVFEHVSDKSKSIRVKIKYT